MWSTFVAAALTIAIENRKPGTPDWEIAAPALHREIEGCASKTSVNGGDAIDLFVNTTRQRGSSNANGTIPFASRHATRPGRGPPASISRG
jgi:hypothetical protein